MTRSIAFPFIVVSLLGFGCAHDPTRELEAARRTYEEAADGPAGEFAKAEVYEAKKALDRAERAHNQAAGSAEEVDLSYVALRKADYAIAFANYLEYEKQTARAKAQYLETLESQKDQAENQLEMTQEELDAKSKALASSLAARQALEQQLSGAMASLSDMAKMRQENQRTIITLNGAVLFRSDDTQLLPIAEDKLGQVAEVLKQYGDEYTISVEGHTDSRGSDQHNEQLSQGRAEAVRKYLISKGVQEQVISARGYGEAKPVANNKSAEGRADNRRVEIIVDRKQDDEQAQPMGRPTPTNPSKNDTPGKEQSQ